MREDAACDLLDPLFRASNRGPLNSRLRITSIAPLPQHSYSCGYGPVLRPAASFGTRDTLAFANPSACTAAKLRSIACRPSRSQAARHPRRLAPQIATAPRDCCVGASFASVIADKPRPSPIRARGRSPRYRPSISGSSPLAIARCVPADVLGRSLACRGHKTSPGRRASLALTIPPNRCWRLLTTIRSVLESPAVLRAHRFSAEDATVRV